MQEREAAKKMFKGTKGDTLRKELVKETRQAPEDAETERIAQLKRRPMDEQQKIKVPLCLTN